MKAFALFVAVLLLAGLSACKKSNNYNAQMLLLNATWSSPGITAVWNGNTVTAAPLAAGQSTGTANNPYIQVPAGVSPVLLKSGNDTLAQKNVFASATNGNMLLFYDTSATAPGGIRVLQLQDDLTRPDTAQLKYRFINVSPDSMATADLWLVNGTTDSSLLAQQAYIGNDVNATDIQAFLTPITYHGQAYTIKIKQANTTNEYIVIPNTYFEVRGIYTFVLSGVTAASGGSGLKLSVLHNFVP